MAAAPLLSLCRNISSPPTPTSCLVQTPTSTCHFNISTRRRCLGVRCSVKAKSYISRSPSPSPSSSVSPWLVLEPGDTVYNFYNLEEDRVVSLNKRNRDHSDETAPDDALVVGSSHGWLALFDSKSKHVFLCNPVSGRHIKLARCPDRWGRPSRVILSCSPDDDGGSCYAVHHPCSGPAVCAVGAGEWTVLVPESYEKDVIYAYKDFAFCGSRGVLSFITRSIFEFDSGGVGVPADINGYRYVDHQIDHWDLAEKKKVDTTWFWKFRGPPHTWKENEDAEMLVKGCHQRLHLVYLQHRGEPLIVVRFEGKYAPYATEGFVVVEMEKEKEGIRVVEDLNGVALFVGMNHSFAVAGGGGNLKPNSIYFTPSDRDDRSSDVGIFDYEKKTFSYPYHFDTNINGGTTWRPMWFTP